MADPAPKAPINPFPAEAVATYGASLQTCATLGYMQTLGGHVADYLKAYVLDPDGVGASISLQGGYGAGKTHALGWVSQLLAESRSIRCASVYVKCDTPNFIDICKQVFAQTSRENLIEIIQLALLGLARKHARSAKSTETLINRLEEPGALQQLDRENNIDLENLRQDLADDIERIVGVSRPIVRVLLDIPSPILGPDAYAWFSGQTPAEILHLGVSEPLVPVGRVKKIDTDLGAITALELIAALYRKAGVPLAVLVDQLEVFVNVPTPDELVVLGSLFKKLVEQLNRHGAMVVVAGTSKGWQRLPADVAPRFRTRVPIAVGRLSSEEVLALLSAYLAPAAIVKLADDIHVLSGGSPREVLRIAYRAFDLFERNGADLTPDDIVMAAAQSGSIADQSSIALGIIDETLGPLGNLMTGLMLADVPVDRVLQDSALRPRLAVVIVKASDELSEIDWYRRLFRLGATLRQEWPAARFIAVLVGYSSDEAAELLSLGDQIRFDEATLSTFVKGKAFEALSAPLRPEDRATTEDTIGIEAVLERLARLEAERIVERRAVSDRFAAASADLASESILGHKLSSRIEIEDALDALRAAAMRGGEPETERKLLRAILIGNETYLKNERLEQLGTLYRDLMNFPQYYDNEDRNSTPKETLLLAMYRELNYRPRAFNNLWKNQILWGVTILAALSGLITALISTMRVDRSGPKYGDRLLGLPAPRDFIAWLPFGFGYLFVLFVAVGACSWYFYSMQRVSGTRRVNRLKAEFEMRSSHPRSFSDHYPQS